MLFNSLSFVIFFPIVFIGYFIVKSRYKNLFLLLASCVFYMAFVPKYVLILFGLITVDFFLAKEINKREGMERKLLLTISIFANIGTLFFFRYFNFFNENISVISNFLHWNYTPFLLQIALPLGLSFHVFQSLSYVIEVYKKKYIPETNYITYALYVMFFPQLVAGPIERPQHLLPQLNQTHEFDSVLARKGLERMLWGFFKKLVIADQIARTINPLYAHLPQDSSLLIIIAVMFSYQLYCDFSGYSDIAVGSSMMLGFNLTENFNRPFAARSITEFWRRWHISLSSWLRDYLYYPLVLSWGKVTKIKMYYSTLITFALIGLWHGAQWTYVVFGALHGIYLIIELATEKVRKKLYKIFHFEKIQMIHHLAQTLTVFVLVSISFVFFRAESLSKVWWFITNMFSSFNLDFTLHQLMPALIMYPGRIVLYVVILAVFIMEIVQYFQEKKNTFYIFDLMPKSIRYGWYYVLTTMILVFGYFGAQTFIYFQF